MSTFKQLAFLMREKQLKIHPSKSGFLIFGSEQFKAACRLDIKKNSVKLGNIIMKEKLQDKYLEDILSSHGLSDSVKETKRKREAKIRGAAYELRALTEDFRMQAALDLYESCLIPSLLTNARTWVDITEEASAC